MNKRLSWFLITAGLLVPMPAAAQVVESVGSRALGMGGAFVGVANDSSASWWNPAGQASGPFVDVALGHTTTDSAGQLPAWRDRASWFALATPPVGLSYYRFRTVAAAPDPPTAQDRAGRQDRRAGVLARSLSASQLGVTVVQSLVPGVHAGTTLKYVRGTVTSALAGGRPSEVLDAGDGLDGGRTDGTFDLDVGVMAVGGPVGGGVVVRNVRQPEFGATADAAGMQLPRQIRGGVAVDMERTAAAVPLTVALDADLRRYTAGFGDRRVVAIGAEQWFLARQFAVRGGARFNTVGAKERAATAGGSVSVRSGLYVEGYFVRGGSADERGWGAAARVTF